MILLEDFMFLNNTLKDWIIAIGVLIISFIVFRILKAFIHNRLKKLSKKTGTTFDDLIVDLIGNIKFFFLLIISLYLATLFLNLSDFLTTILGKMVVIAVLLQGAIWGNRLISHWIERYRTSKLAEDAASVTTFTALSFVLRLLLWSVILLLALDNLGFDITTLIAGLGVGGIAVALAVQNILGDLFASLSIVLDKPFVIGDFIIIDNYLGSVEHIGLKTTRIRSLSGEQLVFSNNDLLNSRIRNYKRMYERRVVFHFGVTYQTPAEKLEIIPDLVKEIIEKQDLVRFDRAHFYEYGDFSLNFEVVYWIKSPDYNVYMDIHQAINLAIFRTFEERQITFAYPTQTLYINHESTSTK